MRRIGFKIFTVCFSFSLVFLVLVGIHYFQILSNPENQRFKEADFSFKNSGLSKHQLLQLGWAQKIRANSSYRNFSPDKSSSDEVRIGIFGGSYVAGAEVGPDYDFPSQLQKLISENHLKSKIKILNFGVGSYGIHQTYLLWKYLAKKYNIDHVIVALMEFHIPRDGSFAFYSSSFFHNSFIPVHSKFVIEGGSLKFIPVVGSSIKDVAQRFFSPFPPLRYLKYNEFLTPFPATLLPRKEGFRLNPFNHVKQKDIKNNTLDTYRLLFEDIARNQKSLLVLCDNDITCGIKSKLRNNNVSFLSTLFPNDFHHVNSTLYKAPGWHRSSAANKLVSQELYAFIAGEQKMTFSYLNRENALEKKPLKDCFLKVKKKELNKISILLNEQESSTLMSMGSAEGVWKDFDIGTQPTNSKFVFYMQEGFEKAFAIPIDENVIDQQEVFIQFQLADKLMEYPIGRIEKLNDWLSLVVVDSSFFTFEDLEIRFLGDFHEKVQIRSEINVSDVKIVPLGIVSNLTDPTNRIFRLSRNSYAVHEFRAYPDDYFEINSLSSEYVTSELSFSYKDKSQLSCPFIQFQKVEKSTNINATRHIDYGLEQANSLSSL